MISYLPNHTPVRSPFRAPAGADWEVRVIRTVSMESGRYHGEIEIKWRDGRRETAAVSALWTEELDAKIREQVRKWIMPENQPQPQTAP